jgi:hypothetical protein
MSLWILPLILLQLKPIAVLPNFEDYHVGERYKGKPAMVDFRSDPDARRFRTRLRQAVAKGPNFAGRYVVVMWGCGTSCQSWAIVDARTGKIHSPLDPTSEGACFRIDSALFVTDPIDQDTFDRYKGELPDWLETRYWKWDGNKMIELASTKTVTEKPCNQR